jgi:hypothetical protein
VRWAGLDEYAKWKLDGEGAGIKLSQSELEVLNGVADALIPPEGGFPAPSAVRVAEDFIVRYVTPAGEPLVHYPQLGEDELRGFLAELFADGAGAEDALRRVERERPDLFAKVRDLVYYGYYSRVEVVGAIRATLEAGRNLRAAPQPQGYLDVTEPWDASLFQHGRGTYTPTEDVGRSVQVRALE